MNKVYLSSAIEDESVAFPKKSSAVLDADFVNMHC